MTKWQKITVLVIIGAVLILGAYDVVAALYGGNGATISMIMTWISQQWWGATIVFAFGYLCGHFFAQDNPVD